MLMGFWRSIIDVPRTTSGGVCAVSRSGEDGSRAAGTICKRNMEEMMNWLPWILVVSMGAPQLNVYRPKAVWTQEDVIETAQDSGICGPPSDVIIGSMGYGIDGCPSFDGL